MANQLQAVCRTYDDAALLQRVDGDLELVAILLDVFLTDAPSSMQAIEHAMETGNVAALKLAAHSLKGAAANISAEDLRDAAGRLEQAATRGASAAELAAGVGRVKETLRALTPVLGAALAKAR
jgi:HPt (histidine-containing phosphotransfer) domain-containing protein